MAECLHDLLQCSICLERFTHPKMLSCQHTFCLNCLRGIAKDEKTLACPQCRVEHQLPKGGVDGLVDNMTIKSLLNMVQPSTIAEAGCFDCGRKRSLSECEHCKESICADCRTSHATILEEIEDRIKFMKHDDGEENESEETGKRLAALLKQITERKGEIPEKFNDLRKIIAEREEKLLRFLDVLEKRVLATESKEARSKFIEGMKDELSACKTVSSLEIYRNLVDQTEQGIPSYLEDPEFAVEIHYDVTSLGHVKLGKHVVETESQCSSRGGSNNRLIRNKALNSFPRNVDYSAKDLHLIDNHLESSKKLVPDYAVYSQRLDTIFCVSEGHVLLYGSGGTETPSLLATYITSCTHIAVTNSGKLLVAEGAAVHIFDCWDFQSMKMGSRSKRLQLNFIEDVDQICCFSNTFALLARNEKKILIFAEDGRFIREFQVEKVLTKSQMAVDHQGQIYLPADVTITEKQETGELKGCPIYEHLKRPSQLLVQLCVGIYVYTWTGQFIRRNQLPFERSFYYTFNGVCGPCQRDYHHIRVEDSVPDDARILDEYHDQCIRGLCVDGDGFLSVARGNQILVYSQKPELTAIEDSKKTEMDTDDETKNTQLKLVTAVGGHMTREGGFAGELGGISLTPDGRMIVCEKGSNRIVIL